MEFAYTTAFAETGMACQGLRLFALYPLCSLHLGCSGLVGGIQISAVSMMPNAAFPIFPFGGTIDEIEAMGRKPLVKARPKARYAKVSSAGLSESTLQQLGVKTCATRASNVRLQRDALAKIAAARRVAVEQAKEYAKRLKVAQKAERDALKKNEENRKLLQAAQKAGQVAAQSAKELEAMCKGVQAVSAPAMKELKKQEKAKKKELELKKQEQAKAEKAKKKEAELKKQEQAKLEKAKKKELEVKKQEKAKKKHQEQTSKKKNEALLKKCENVTKAVKTIRKKESVLPSVPKKKEPTAPAFAQIYVLELEGGYIYVGKSKDVKGRFRQHMAGKGAYFTKLHKPTGRMLKRLGTLEGDGDGPERDETLRQMHKHGADRVRGWRYCSSKLSEEERRDIEINMREMFDLCRKCGRVGHFSTECRYQADDAPFVSHGKSIPQRYA